MNKIRLATVFSGIGSIEFALKRLNIPYDIVFACDNGERDDVIIDYEKEFKIIKNLSSKEEKQKYQDELYKRATRRTNFVQESYLANYDLPENRFYQDIKLLDGTDFEGDVDLFVGGSPCQSFSSVGFQGGLSDTRGTLFYEFARLISEIKPRVFIYENVRNLLKHDGGKTWNIIQNVFNSLGYNISFAVLNSADFGIPQTRRRLFVVGYKDKNTIFKFPEGKKLKYAMADFMIDNCSFGNFSFNKKGELVLTKENGIVDEKYILTPLLYKYVMSSGTKTWYQAPIINLPIARTLLKTMGNRHRAGVDNYYSNDGSNSLGKVRMLTEREAHRLMGYTDDYKIVVSRGQAYKQAGNSIVVDVMMELVRTIIKDNIFSLNEGGRQV